MGLDDIVRNAVALADTVTKDLQTDVQHFAWIKTEGDGEIKYADPVIRKAIVQRVQRRALTFGKQEIQSRGTIFLMAPIEPNGAPDRQEPIDSRDKFIMADGTTGPILDIEGLLDPKTNEAYAYNVWLGFFI